MKLKEKLNNTAVFIFARGGSVGIKNKNLQKINGKSLIEIAINQAKNFKNLQVFAVNMEQPNTLKTKKFFDDLNIKKLEIFFDSNLNFVKEFKLRGVPTTVLINKKGEEFARIIGEVDFLDKKFLKWLSNYD